MPTVLRIDAYRFFFYSGDRVERDENQAKFWLKPVKLERSSGFSRQELRKIQSLIEDNVEHILRSWNEYFED